MPRCATTFGAFLLSAFFLHALADPTAHAEPPSGVAIPQEAVSRGVTIVNAAAGVPEQTEAISRAVTIVNRAGSVPDISEGISRAFTLCNHNAAPDSDGDGVNDCDDQCPGFDDLADHDRDGIPDGCDNCPSDPNSTQADCDHDGVGDTCAIVEGRSNDCNLNGIPDECESLVDCDEDGVADICEPDCNGNGIVDKCDIRDGTSTDCTGNGVPDECEPDCNGNGRADSCDIASGRSSDCTGNGIPDECEPDCNNNLAADSCDIGSGTSVDCNHNSVPDECELDCNQNGRADACDVADGTSEDCNGDNVPDECSLPKDVVPSGATDLADFAAMQNCLNPNAAPAGTCANADLDDDGRVATSDFILLQAAIGSRLVAPDITLSRLDSDTRVVRGGSAAISIQLTNVGCRPAAGSLGVITTLLQDDGTGNSSEVLRAEHQVELIDVGVAGVVDVYNVTIPSSLSAGHYELRVCADSTTPRCADQCDADPSNNCDERPLEVAETETTVHLSAVDPVGPLVAGRESVVRVGVQNTTLIEWRTSVDLLMNGVRVGSCVGTSASGPAVVNLLCQVHVPNYDLVCAEEQDVTLGARLTATTALDTGIVMDEIVVPARVKSRWWDLRFELKNVPSSATICSRIGWDIEVCNVGGVTSDDVCFFSGINLFAGAGNWVGTNLGLANFHSGHLASGACATFRVHDYLVDYPDGFRCNAVRGRQYVKVEINYNPGGCFDHCFAGNYDQRAIMIR